MPEITVKLQLSHREDGELPQLTLTKEEDDLLAVKGDIFEVKVCKDGKSQFGFMIRDDGSLVFMDYGPMLFSVPISSNTLIETERPWEKEEKDGVPD